MTFLDAERIVRKITETLRQPALEAQAAALAREYAEACATTCLRLAQCAAMFFEGHDDRQGLQHAETPPPLLDLITVLAFRQAAEWREYCQARGLAVADGFDAKAIKRLNEAYGQGLNPDHRLYKEYRRAIQRREDEQALSVLRLIASLSPADKQIAGDVRQLEDKILRAKMDRLRAAVDIGDKNALMSALLEVEAFPRSPAPDDELWRRAHLARCGVWLEAVAPLRPRRAWREAAHWLGKVKGACARHSLVLDSAAASVLADAESWVAEAKAAFQENANFHRALADVQGLLAAIDEKLSSTRRFGLDELRQDLENLGRKWRELEQFQREVPDDLADRTRKSLRLLRAQIERRQKGRKLLAAAAVAATVAAALLAGLILKTNRAARDLAGELKEFERSRQVAAAEKLIAQVAAKQSNLTNAPAARSALGSAMAFIANERRQFEDFKRMSARLAEQAEGGFEGASLEQTQAAFDSARRHAAALAAEFQPAADEALIPSRTKWERHLDARRQEREKEFEKKLRAAEELAAGGLKYERGPAVVGETLAKLQPLAHKLDALTNAPLPSLAVSAELLQAFASLKRRQEGSEKELAHWDKVAAVLHHPASLDGYKVALTNLQKSEFASAAQVRAAAEMTGLNVTPSRLLSALLTVEPSRDWTAQTFSPMPDSVTSEDRAKYTEVRDDLNFLTVSSCVLTQVNGANEQVLGTRPVWVRGGFTTNKVGVPLAVIYDPADSPGALDFKERKLQYSEVRFQRMAQTKESDLFERAGLREFDTQGHYNAALLPALDLLNQDTEASPVFRAWLAMKLHAIIEKRPVDWGEVWAPAVAAHRQRLRDLGADRIKSGDWLVPKRLAIFDRSMQEHFAKASAVSYVKQATFFNKLSRRVTEAGFQFAGYADMDRTLVLVPASAARGELWGWSAATKTPVLLFRDGVALGEFHPMPFTPLFAPRQRRDEWIRQAASDAGVKVGVDEATRPLPPLFVVPYE